MSKKHDQKTSNVEAPEVEENRTITAAGSKLTPLRKLTIAGVYGEIKMSDLPAVDADNSDKALCRLSGYASGVKEGGGTYGTWAMLQGEFAGVNKDTGEYFIAAGCFVPGAMGDALVTATKKMIEDTPGAKLSFCVDVFARRSKKEPEKKHEYIVRPAIETTFASPAMALLSMSMS